jgi:hypothetical protein
MAPEAAKHGLVAEIAAVVSPNQLFSPNEAHSIRSTHFYLVVWFVVLGIVLVGCCNHCHLEVPVDHRLLSCRLQLALLSVVSARGRVATITGAEFAFNLVIVDRLHLWEPQQHVVTFNNKFISFDNFGD